MGFTKCWSQPIFAQTATYLVRSQTTVAFFKVPIFHSSFSFFTPPACSLNYWLPFLNRQMASSLTVSAATFLLVSVQCMFSLKGIAVTNPGLKAIINSNALSTVKSTYLGVTLSNNAKWTTVLRKSLDSVYFSPLL